MSAFVQTSLIGVAIAATFVVFFTVKPLRRLPVGLVMIAAAIVGALADGWGIPLRHLVEGSLYFFYLMMVIAAGMILVKTLEKSGMLDALTRGVISRFYRFPGIVLSLLILVYIVPGMLTGSAPATVLSTGVIMAPILLRMGIPKIETAAILAVGSIAAQQAPPVNVPIMIMATGAFFAYQGFALPLLILNIPLAIITVLYLGRRFVSVDRLRHVAAEMAAARDRSKDPPSLLLYVPLLAVAVLWATPRIFYRAVPDLATPLTFMIGSVVAVFTGRRFNYLQACREAMREAQTVLGLFVGVGVLVQVLSLTGVRGLIATMTVSLPRAFLYPASAVVAPLLGGPLVPFGTAAVIGPPMVLAFQDVNIFIVASGLALLIGLGCLVPPTNIGGVFACQVVGVERYGPVFRRCIVPALYALIAGMIFMIFADRIGAMSIFRQ